MKSKQLVVIELEGRTYEEQMSSLLGLICGISECRNENRMGLHEWPLLFSRSWEGSIRMLKPTQPKPCALCGGPEHSGPCYYRDGSTP